MKQQKEIKLTRFDNFDNKDDSIPSVSYFYNFSPSDKLENTVGVRSAIFPYEKGGTDTYELDIDEDMQVLNVSYFRQFFSTSSETTHRLLIYCADKKLYLNELFVFDPTLISLYDLEFDTPPITLAYKNSDADAIILASEDKMVVWKTNYLPYQITNAPIITSMCMNEEVLFCTLVEPAFKIWYASDLDVEKVGNTAVKNSGYLSLEDDLGDCKKVLNFNGDVYVIREFGISRIRSAQGELSVSQIYSSNSLIYHNSVSVCGNYLIFMTTDSICLYNGNKVTKLDLDLSKFMPADNSNASASSLGDYYYLALKLDFADGQDILCEGEDCVNNALLVLNTQDYSYQLVRGVDIRCLLPLKIEGFERMLLTFNTAHTNKIGEIFSTPVCFDEALPKFWLSESLTDDYNTKLFTKLTVFADENVTFKLLYDDKSMAFTTFTSGLNEFCFKVCCKDIKLQISSSADSANVEKVTFEFYEY